MRVYAWLGLTIFIAFVENVLDGMQAHLSSVSVQTLGCEALVLLASENAVHRGDIIDAGGISVVLEAMRRHVSE